jgi:hypothetical protein
MSSFDNPSIICCTDDSFSFFLRPRFGAVVSVEGSLVEFSFFLHPRFDTVVSAKGLVESTFFLRPSFGISSCFHFGGMIFRVFRRVMEGRKEF